MVFTSSSGSATISSKAKQSSGKTGSINLGLSSSNSNGGGAVEK